MSRTILRFAVLLAVTAASRAQEAGATHADWPHYGGTQYSWRYSALDQVNTSNVKNLLPAWIFQTGDYADNLSVVKIRPTCKISTLGSVGSRRYATLRLCPRPVL
jgi:hypothetical protein